MPEGLRTTPVTGALDMARVDEWRECRSLHKEIQRGLGSLSLAQLQDVAQMVNRLKTNTSEAVVEDDGVEPGVHFEGGF